jgi:hypothetical protein
MLHTVSALMRQSLPPALNAGNRRAAMARSTVRFAHVPAFGQLADRVRWLLVFDSSLSPFRWWLVVGAPSAVFCARTNQTKKRQID